jgi:hypothetical protein
MSSEWQHLFGDSTFQFSEPETVPLEALSPSPTDQREFDAYIRRENEVSSAMELNDGFPVVPEATIEALRDTPSVQSLKQREKTVRFATGTSEATETPVETVETPPSAPQESSTSDTGWQTPALRRSARQPKPTKTLTIDPSKKSYQSNYYSVLSEDLDEWDRVHPCDDTRHMSASMATTTLAFKAAVSDPDTLSYDQAIRSPQVHYWREAAKKEITELADKGTWVEVPKSEAQGTILPGTWVFKLKRSPDGTPRKYKARYCVRGDLQDGVFDTYAPVVQWSTVRIILALSTLHEWHLISCDFANAFVQAELKTPVWIHLPRGFRSDHGQGTCLRLKKSLYGLSVAPKLWFEKLSKALMDDGFVQSKNDECLFIKSNMIIFFWVDDAGIAYKSMKEIDSFIERLREKGFELSKDIEFSEYLGIKFEKKDGKIEMTQPGLIKKILKATGMEDCNPNHTPTASTTLSTDAEGEPMKEKWGYSSIVGMLLYLSTNTRPDITFAVSQVARFSSNPKQSHAKAIKIIVRYLAGTINKGIIFSPAKDLKLDAWSDSDFAGLHGSEHQDNPVSSKSRTGYIIFFGNCPLVWRSSLQTEAATSTFHAEYVALSTCAKVIIWIQIVPTKIFEDNSSAYLLANNHQLTPRSRWLNTKLHWFWEQVNNGLLKVEKCATTEQRSDYMTKPLVKVKFEENRRQVQGW